MGSSVFRCIMTPFFFLPIWCRTKTKQTEVDCEYLKRCCDNLTQENKRLQKEVQELRALKLLSPQLYMHMKPPTTLTMCPSCQRVSVPSSSSSSPSSSSVAASLISPTGPVHNPFSLTGASISPWARLQMQQGLNNLHSWWLLQTFAPHVPRRKAKSVGSSWRYIRRLWRRRIGWLAK